MKRIDIETSSNRSVGIGGTVIAGRRRRAVGQVLEQVELGDDPDRAVAAGRDDRRRAA